MGYLDLRAALLDGDAAAYACLVGTMVQEAYATHPEVRAACEASIYGYSATLEDDFAALITARGAPPGVTARSHALHVLTVLQGAFVLAKASEDRTAVLDALAHLRRYLECLFSSPHNQEAVVDPFGHSWALVTPVRQLSVDEMQEAMPATM